MREILLLHRALNPTVFLSYVAENSHHFAIRDNRGHVRKVAHGQRRSNAVLSALREEVCAVLLVKMRKGFLDLSHVNELM